MLFSTFCCCFKPVGSLSVFKEQNCSDQGEVRIRNYDFQGKPPAVDSTDTFQIRETRNDLILPGRFSTLGQKRENIHDLAAGKNGARVMDVFTFFSGRATSRYLDLQDKPRDLDARIYDATWKSRRRRNR